MSIWTPKFLQDDAFGLDISDRSFKYAKLKKEHDMIDTEAFGQGSFPQGAIVAGEIKNLDAAARALADAVRAARLSTKNVVLALPEERGFLRKVEVPGDVPDKDLRSFLELHVEEHIPIALEEAVFDYEVIPADNAAAAESDSAAVREVIVTAFPRAIVDQYSTMARRAGLEPIVCETEMHALARVAIPREETRTVMVLDIGETRAGVLIAERGVVSFTSTKLIGGGAMIEAIERATGADRKEATRLFFEEGLNPAQREVFNALIPMAATLRDEVAKHLAFWQTRARQSPAHILLAGGIAHLEGLPEYLAYELRIPVSHAAIERILFDIQKGVPAINRHDALVWAVALGLAMRGI